jgi:hypothetical protein
MNRNIEPQVRRSLSAHGELQVGDFQDGQQPLMEIERAILRAQEGSQTLCDDNRDFESKHLCRRADIDQVGWQNQCRSAPGFVNDRCQVQLQLQLQNHRSLLSTFIRCSIAARDNAAKTENMRNGTAGPRMLLW